MSTAQAAMRRVAMLVTRGFQAVRVAGGARPIRDHLVMLVMATLLPVLIFGAYAVWRVADAERKAYEQQLRNIADDLAADIDRAIDSTITTLKALATSTELQHGDFAAFHAKASVALSQSRFSVIVVDTSLEVVVNTIAPFGTRPERIASNDALTRIFVTRQPSVSNVFKEPSTGKPFLSVGVPALSGDTVRYVLGMLVEPDYIQRILLGQSLPAHWVSGVSDAHGMIIARSAKHEQYLATKLPSELFQRRRDTTIFRTENVDSTPVLRAVAPLRSADWVAAATAPISFVQAASRRAYLILGIFGLSALALSLGIAAVLSRMLSSSILQLESASQAIRSGTPVQFAPPALAEAAAVQTALQDAQEARLAFEEQLRLSGERLSLAARIAGIASATVTFPIGGPPLVELSSEFAAVVGLPERTAFSADALSSVIHAEDRDAVIAKFIAAIGQGGDGTFQAEHRIYRADGSVAWINVRSTTFFDGAGADRRPHMTVVAIRDITVRKRSDEALRASEARYRAALIVGRIVSWETNLLTNTRLWTPEAAALFDLALPGPVGRVGGPEDEYRNALHPEDRHLMRHFHRLGEAMDEFAAEYRILRRDGRVLWVSGRGHIVERDAAGKPVRFINVVADITEQKLAEDALKASEARFRMLAEAIPNISWTATPTGTVDWHSPRWSEYTGMNIPLPSNDSWQPPIHPDDLAITEEAWQAAVAAGETFEVEHRIRGKDGTYCWFLSRAVPVRDAEGSITAWVGTATNIDDLKTTQGSLARYVAVAEAAHDGLISITPSGIIESWNAGAERLFGYAPEEIIGCPTSSLVPGKNQQAHRQMLATVVAGGVIGPIDVKRKHKDGRLVDVAISMTGVRDERGVIVSIAKVAHDISGRLEAERRQLLLNRELAHRVKNTLAVLQAIMRATMRNSPTLESFAETFSGRMQSMSLAQDLLTEREWHNAELCGLAKRQLAPHAAAGRLEISGPLVELQADLAVPLGLLLHELATNAVKYGALSAPLGRVALSWTVQEGPSGPEVEIIWQERGGPPVAEGNRRGFGSVLIEQGLPTATVTRSFGRDGMRCSITIPLERDAANDA